MIALLIAAGVAATMSIFGTRFTIRYLSRIGRGQPILGRDELGPEHQHKEGTPTMGGIAILAAAFVGYLAAHVRTVYFSDQAFVILGGVAALALVGFTDDFIKVRAKRNRGIFWKRKSHIMLGVSFLIALTLWLTVDINTTLSFTRADWPGIELNGAVYVLWCTAIIFATAHAVNVTDGLDGLAAGSALFGFFAFTIIAFWGFRNPTIYSIVNPLDLSVLAVSFAAACAGFLWWNAAPARIFMGDVGALGLGAALALLGITTNTMLLLPIICGLQVTEILSVAAQMGSYRYFGHRRIFKMSPIHHHFELIGWPETTVIIRFWLISGIFVAVALGIYYADFARVIGVGMKRPRALVYGLAVAGEATARALLARRFHVTAADDRPTAEGVELARELGIDLYEAPSMGKVERLVERADLVVPSPGVPEGHPLIVSAQRLGVPLRSEIDLAYEWEAERPGGGRPMLAVTGTDGKTTTTLLATAMLDDSGVSAVACGNTETPLVSALDADVEAFVVECTSFRLAWTSCFRPEAAVWLNLAPDHLDWHATMDSYIAAKSRIWLHQQPFDAAIGFLDDPVVMDHLGAAPGRHVTFGASGADYHVADGWLVGPQGRLAEVASMRRRLPHDITNALAAAALVLEPGLATVDGVASALATFDGPHHRIELVGAVDGVAYYDDSKATTPHAAVTAIRSFDHVVLLAGGRNKGLDLGAMAEAPERMRAVVAMGEAATEVDAAFAGICPVTTAGSMDEAVDAARGLAGAGDVVLLSPGCASFDWYKGYAERGDDFARAVRARMEAR